MMCRHAFILRKKKISEKEKVAKTKRDGKVPMSSNPINVNENPLARQEKKR